MVKKIPCILHIDDNKIFLELFSLAFEKWFTITSVDNCRSALDMICACQFDVVITDYDMPDMDGIDLLKKIKEVSPETPVVFCTGQGSEDIAREVFIRGAWDYFTKEFSNLAYKEKIVNSIYTAVEVRRTIQEKKETERKFLDIADILPVMVFETDAEGNITYLNRFAYEITGYSREDLTEGINFFSIIDPEYNIQLKENLNLVLAGNDIGHKKYRFIGKDKNLIPIFVYALPVIKQGIVTGLRGIALELTQDKQSDLLKNTGDVLKSKDLFEKIFKSQTDAILLLDDGFPAKILDCNPAVTSIFGYLREELIEKPVEIIHVNEESHVRFSNHISSEINKNGSVYIPEYSMKRKDGTIFPTEHTVVFLRDKDGKILGRLSNVRDISQRMTVEENLRKSENKFRKLMENSPIPIALCDFNNQVSFINSKFTEAFGYSLDDGQTLDDWWFLVFPDEKYREKVKERWFMDLKNAMENDGEIKPYEYHMTCKDGTVRDVERFGTIVDGQFILIFKDNTERKQMEKELISRNIELNDFTHRVSHDLKGPLALIGGYADIIKENPELFDKYFGNIKQQSEKLITFINSLLELSRAGRILGTKSLIRTGSLIRQAFTNIKQQYKEMELKMPDSTPEIFADPLSMEQVFANLINNSAKYNNPDNEQIIIEVGSITSDHSVTIYIKDNGLGMEGKYLEEIFNPGFVINNNRGTGFGLSIVKKIIEAHGGRVWAESPGLNKGTTFYIKFPVT